MERPQYYRLLPDHSVEPCEMLEWAQQMTSSTPDERRVARDTVQDYLISTVFLGMNHNWDLTGPPLIFETMCFDSEGNEVDVLRYSTWEQAEWGHKEIVRRMIERLDPQWLLYRGYPVRENIESGDEDVDET